MSEHKKTANRQRLLGKVQEAAIEEPFGGRNLAAITGLKEEIQQVLERGYTLRLVWKTLKQQGKVAMSYDRFRVLCRTVGLRRAPARRAPEERARREPAAVAVRPVASEERVEANAQPRPARTPYEARVMRPPERSDHGEDRGFLHPARVKPKDMY